MTSRIEALSELTDAEYARLVPERPQIVAYRGSHTHGTYMPPEDATGHDDVDLITVYIDPDRRRYFGTEGQTWTGRDVKIGRWDGVTYEFQHFAKLAATCNPNVLSTFWLKPEYYLYVSTAGRTLLRNRDLFTSRLAANSFGGYAMGQLKRMTAWRDQKAAGCGCEGEFHEASCPLRAERGRGSSKLYATGFMGAKRKALVEKYGYDVKNAAHLIRLLRMGLEFLQTGQLNVWREDRDSLLAIKRGYWPLERVTGEADLLFALMNEARHMSPLPERPDFGAINDLVTNCVIGELFGAAEMV